MKKIFTILTIASILIIVFSELTKERARYPHFAKYISQKIVSLSPNLTEIVFALELGDKVVGVSSDSDWPGEAKLKTRVGSFWQPNIEAIIAAKPTLVVCESFLQHKEAAETLKRSGINVLSLRVESIDELYLAITNIGQATECPDKAGELAGKIKNELEQIRSKASSVPKVKVLWVIQTEPMRVIGVKTFVNEIIDIAGGQNVIAPTGDQYPAIGTETILTSGAEVIIQSAMGTQDIKKQQDAAEKFWNSSDSRFANLPAVKNKKIYVINSDTVLRLGPRLPQGVMAVARLLHPELFPKQNDPNRKPDK